MSSSSSSNSNSNSNSSAKAAWHEFLDVYDPLRPELYRYCRYLTRSSWDAEDLAQDTLARAFVTLAASAAPPPNPRAWLFRVASNLWINHVSRKREVLGVASEDAAERAEHADPRAAREAAGTLLVRLSPQERAAVVLADVFELSLAETAEVLTTTPGAIKAALHRGRGKLAEPAPEDVPTVTPAVLDAFCAAFNARDLAALTAVLLESATMEYPGLIIESGAAAIRDGTFHGTLLGCDAAPPEYRTPPRCELRVHRGEPILVWWWGDAVRGIVRVELAGDRIARLVNYFHAPDVLAEVCGELALPVRTNGYRYWRSN